VPTPDGTRDRRTIFGWCMYDWANSAYGTTTLVGLLPIYFATAVVVDGPVKVFGTAFSATTLWSLAVSGAGMLALLAAPVQGAIADFTAAKKRFLLFFAYLGSLFTCLLWFSGSGDVLQTMVVFMVAQFAFVSANVFYDAYLPQLVAPGQLDRISSRGYAFGYLGGGLNFAISLGLVLGATGFTLPWAGGDGVDVKLPLSIDQAARLAMVISGVWWGGFTLFLAFWVPETRPRVSAGTDGRQGPWQLIRIGFQRTWETTKQVRRFGEVLRFLIAFMLYNDGIQTIFFMATIFATQELKLDPAFLMFTVLSIQAVAFFGTVIFGNIAQRLGTKPTLLMTLVLWTAVAVYGYFMESALEFFILGLAVGLVQGGTQALSRSLYSAVIPVAMSAEFFGFFTVFSKFSAILGPLTFGLTDWLTGSLRLSILSLIVFFVAGFVLLASMDVAKAKAAKEAGTL
jgi:MFS transporter, UMF1 family